MVELRLRSRTQPSCLAEGTYGFPSGTFAAGRNVVLLLHSYLVVLALAVKLVYDLRGIFR